MKRLFRYFIQGLILVAPAGLTILIIVYVFNKIDAGVQKLLLHFMPYEIPGAGIVVLLFLITLLGFLGGSIIFKPIKFLIKASLDRAPFLKVLYTSINDLLSAFVGSEKKFNRPVLVKVNTISNLEKIGFLTKDDLSELKIKDKVAVYFPHSYNFSGEMFIVPVEHITPLDIPASEIMKFVVSGGVTKV